MPQPTHHKTPPTKKKIKDIEGRTERIETEREEKKQARKKAKKLKALKAKRKRQEKIVAPVLLIVTIIVSWLIKVFLGK